MLVLVGPISMTKKKRRKATNVKHVSSISSSPALSDRLKIIILLPRRRPAEVRLIGNIGAFKVKPCQVQDCSHDGKQCSRLSLTVWEARLHNRSLLEKATGQSSAV